MNTEQNTVTTVPSKERLLELLYGWVNQRPGIDARNYFSDWRDVNGRRAYAAEVRAVGRDLKDARALLRAVELARSITAEDLLRALEGAFAGRLSYNAESDSLDYCTGQYWPTEYRKAVCAVCANALWRWIRATSMPKPTYRQHGGAKDHPMRTEELYDGLSAGDWLRRYLRREFGRGIASRWFS